MSLAVQMSFNQMYQYESCCSTLSHTDTDFGAELMGKATSRTDSSDNGKNIGVMTIGNKGFIAKYADSSTEQDPIIKIGEYEVRVNNVNPKNATEIEMFALTSYMDDKGLTDNTGMKTFNKMRAFSFQAEYNGFCSGISDSMTAWSLNRDWGAILQNAKETFFAMPQAYEQGLKCQSIIDSLESWSDDWLLKRAQSGDTSGARELIDNNASNEIIQKSSTSSEGLTLRYRKDHVAEETDDESMDLSEAIRHFEEMHKITAEELKETDDWRNMSKDQWDKLLEGVDDFIDAQIERLREMKEVQEEAARKAAMMAPPDMRTVAASQAALDVAASGFMGATEPDAGTEHEKNWTKNLVTDDQVVLRTAKAAQEMETMAQARIAELAGGEASASSYADQPVWKWRDGIFGFSAEVFKNADTDAEYTLRLRYDDGREETRVINANEIDPANCNIIDLHLKMYHLNDEGKIDQRSLMMNLTTAHLYMNYRIPDATVNTAADFISWYEQQLALERKYSPNSNNRGQLEQLLMYLSAS